jgi:DNA processing protein
VSEKRTKYTERTSSQDEWICRIGLTFLPNIGDVLAKNLVSYCGSASEVFKAKGKVLQKIPGIGEVNAKHIIKHKRVLDRAEVELNFMERYKITPLFFTEDTYPQRLKYCNDSPVLLYYKGSANLNSEKIVSVVGTRTPDDYGKNLTQQLISELKNSGVLVVSGLAYGIDIAAHRAALDEGLDTVGVVAHGLDRIYPSVHQSVATKMIRQGGILTDFMSGTNPDAVNFPKRNRIVAGMCDALVVVQSKKEGGSLITATIANSYNKDVFAFPGRAGEALSEGCNGLIKRNRAAMIESAADLLDAMCWNVPEKRKAKKQLPLLISLTEEEQKLTAVFKENSTLHLDDISYASGKTVSEVSTLLLQLEFQGLIKSKPGKMYEFLG